MRDRINTDVKLAMKAGDKEKLGTLRLMNAAIQSADMEAQAKGKPKLEDPDLVPVFSKMLKQRRDSIEQFNAGNRPDLAKIEQAEIAVIEAYLPKQMGADEIRAAVQATIKETGAAGAKDMGRVMAVMKQRHAGEMDFAKASGLVKELLK